MSLEFDGMTPADFADTARRAVAGCAGKSLPEQARHLAADGLLSACAPLEAGGMGLPIAFALPVVQAGGAALLSYPIVEAMLFALHLGSYAGGSAVVDGTKVATIAWRGEAGFDGAFLSGAVAAVAAGTSADIALVRLSDGRGAIVDLRAGGVSAAECGRTIDAVLPEAMVRFDGVSTKSFEVVAANVMARLETDALVLKAAAVLSSAEECLDAARRHATDRKQFGKPLIANQTVRHHLARHKTALESGRVILAQAASGNADERTVRSAFQSAVTGAIAIAEGAIQIHGGMGFTWEMPLHLHLRRIRTLEEQAGAGANLDRLVADYFGAARSAGLMEPAR